MMQGVSSSGTAMRSRKLAVALLCLGLSAQSAPAAGVCLHGVNLAGAEFGRLGDAHGKGYLYPSRETIDYFAGKGFNTVRLPFLWERLQPALYGALDAAELGRLREAVRQVRGRGMAIILDPHNYGRFRGEPIGSKVVPASALADFWQRLATVFRDSHGVAFGVMNEPHGIAAEDWLAAANGAIGAIRRAGAGNLVLVPGTAWSGAHSWLGGDYGTANAAAMLAVVDPRGNYAYEFHQYFDADFSGKHGECSRAVEAVAAIGAVSGWLREHGRRGFLGEFGVPAKAECLSALGDMVRAVETDADVWLGWAYWAGGDWWPPDEALNIQPASDGDRPQMKVLSGFLTKGASCRR